MAYVRIPVSGSLSAGAADYVLKEDIGSRGCSFFTTVWTARRRLSNHSSTTCMSAAEQTSLEDQIAWLPERQALVRSKIN